ncbi:MAG: alpha/beta hydrolase [Candidatus Heimdallarchaeota archaeon]|nr:MAG: alpha/beta hydrolase [Candidatus Heimdallarchaeota archaeon]
MPYYTRDGYQLYYYRNGEGYPIVFVHGYLGSSQTHWGSQLNNNQFSQFHLIAPDLRGYGRSSIGKKVEKHHTEDHLLDMHELITNELQLKQKPVFVGYSIGGTLALKYAIKYPENVQSIVLVSPRPFLGKITRSWNFLAKEKRSGENRSLLISILWRIVKRVQKIKTYISIKRQYKGSNQYIQQLEQIDVPILMIHGNKDTVNPSITYRVLKEHLPKAKIIELESDHGIAHEHSEQFNDILYEFLIKTK